MSAAHQAVEIPEVEQSIECEVCEKVTAVDDLVWCGHRYGQLCQDCVVTCDDCVDEHAHEEWAEHQFEAARDARWDD